MTGHLLEEDVGAMEEQWRSMTGHHLEEDGAMEDHEGPPSCRRRDSNGGS